jgi:hypothetical protein
VTSSRRTDLAPVVEAAQKVAGVLAARSRGDHAGARSLMDSFDDPQQLAGGALLVAELSLGMLRQETGEPVEACVRELCLNLERALA